MAQHEASRTLVKSPPELWTECSDAASLARHLGEFGEIGITRLDPETAVAWEGERVSGTVRIEPSGWGTRVTLTAVEPEPKAPPEPDPPAAEPEARAPEPERMAEPEPDLDPAPGGEEPAPLPAAPPGVGFMARVRLLFGRRERLVAAEPEPAPPPAVPETEPEPAPEPEAARPEYELVPDEPGPKRPEAESTPDASKVLASALESLGQAHHRPFSRG